MALIAFLFASCGRSVNEHLAGPFYLKATDIDKDLGICFQKDSLSGNCQYVVYPSVRAVGNNGQFIIAKQRLNMGLDEPWPGEKVTFYIIQLTADFDIDNPKTVFGPLTKKEFDSLSRKWAIDQLTFTHVYFDD